MVQCSTAVKQMSLQMFFEYCQTSSVDYIVRENVPHGRRRDGESATADDRSCPRDDQFYFCLILIIRHVRQTKYASSLIRFTEYAMHF